MQPAAAAAVPAALPAATLNHAHSLNAAQHYLYTFKTSAIYKLFVIICDSQFRW